MPAEKKKAQKSLPPKPSTFSDEQWALAHSASKLLEVLAAPERAAHSASSKTGEKPLASKPSAALWLCQLLGSSSDASEEAFKAGAVEICAKLTTTHSSDHAILASLLGALTHMASPSAGAIASQVREAFMTVRPAVVPALLGQLEQFSVSSSISSSNPTVQAHHSSTSSVAAALGLLAVLASSPDTRLRVTKLMAGWTMKPLVAALISQKALPLEGGRHAVTNAAAILETICAPAATPTAAADTSGSKKGGKKGSKDSEGSKKEATAVPVGDPIDPTLTAAVQQGVLAADGITALMKLCAAVGAPASARASAAAALQHLMTAHGREEHVKAEFVIAGGIPTMLKLMVSTTLPLPTRAAAAGCIWHYLAPKPAETAVTTNITTADATSAAASTATAAAAANRSLQASAGFFLSLGPAAGNPAVVAAAVAAVPSPRGALMQPVTSQEARSNLIAAARTARRQQQQAQQEPGPSAKASSNGGGSASSSMSGGRSSVRTSIAAPTAAAAAGSSTETLSPEEQAAAAAASAAAAYRASLAVWDAAAQAGLAARVEQVIQCGCVPALLLLCCEPDGAPASLVAAAAAAAAAAQAATAAAAAAASESTSAAAICGAEASAVGSSSLRAGSNALISGGLGAIVEPSHGEEGTEDDESDGEAADPTTADSAALTTAGAAGGAASSKKAKKSKKKGSTKVDPAVQTAQSHASAAIKLLALSGDAGRAALQAAGAKAVLVPLLAGPAALARWNARQALMAMALTSSNKAGARAASSSIASQLNAAGTASTGSSPSRPTSSSSHAWQCAAEPVVVPNYIAMSNLPASHYQRSAPISQVPMPVLPMVPGKQRATDSISISVAAGAAGAAGGSTAAGAARPSSTARRTSMSNLAGSIAAAGRLGSGSFYGSNAAAAGDGQGPAADASFAGANRVSVMKGPRTSMLAAATGPGSAPVTASASGAAQ